MQSFSRGHRPEPCRSSIDLPGRAASLHRVQPSDRKRRWWSVAFTFVVSPLMVIVTVLIMLPTPAAPDPGGTVRAINVLHSVPVPATTTTSPSTTMPPTAVPPSTTTVPPRPTVLTSDVVPAQGEATASGCEAALTYLTAYAAPGFQLVCPGYAGGHQAATCFSESPCVPGQKMIVIADPCPAAYMNEAHNSWAIQDGGTIDPYGYCRD
jgi:hypothetical protein